MSGATSWWFGVAEQQAVIDRSRKNVPVRTDPSIPMAVVPCSTTSSHTGPEGDFLDSLVARGQVHPLTTALMIDSRAARHAK